jgi:hypothetical protein
MVGSGVSVGGTAVGSGVAVGVGVGGGGGDAQEVKKLIAKTKINDLNSGFIWTSLNIFYHTLFNCKSN